MRADVLHDFNPVAHLLVVMDDVSGVDFVLRNKKVLQAHADGALLGQSPTQRFAHGVSLWRVPIVLTCNDWDIAALSATDANWVAENCVVEHITARVFMD